MAQAFYVEVDKADLRYVMKKLQDADKNAPRVLRNAINRTATSGNEDDKGRTVAGLHDSRRAV